MIAEDLYASSNGRLGAIFTVLFVILHLFTRLVVYIIQLEQFIEGRLHWIRQLCADPIELVYS